MPRTTKQIVEQQNQEPVLIVTGCHENALDDGPRLSRNVFKALNLPCGDDGYPLTNEESDYVTDDTAKGPYGGVEMNYAMLYKGEKYIAPTVMICFIEKPGDPRFSPESYGNNDDSLYEDEAEALYEAQRLVNYLQPIMTKLGGFVYLDKKVEPDRHGVTLMFPINKITHKFQQVHDDKRALSFSNYLTKLFDGYESTPAKLPELV